ncbi:MAG: carboxypeptidase-like regulatory domain-containing protein, partial [Bacillota bacterium]
LRYSSPSVQGATVAITGTGHVATTNSRGEFTFYDVPPGVYNVRACGRFFGLSYDADLRLRL